MTIRTSACFVTLPSFNLSDRSGLPSASVLAAQAYAAASGKHAVVVDLNLLQHSHETSDVLTQGAETILATDSNLLGITVESHNSIFALQLMEHLASNNYSGHILIGGIGANAFPATLSPNNLSIELVSVPAEEYFLSSKSLARPRYESYVQYEDYKQEGFLETWYTQTARGCPFSCAHCVIPITQGRRVVRKASELLRHEIASAATYGANELFIVDDAFVVSKTHFTEVCDLIKRNWSKGFQCMARGGQIGKYHLEILIDSGCSGILIGEDAATPGDFAALDRPTPRQTKTYHLVQQMKQAGMMSSVYLLVGYPGQSSEGLRALAKTASSLEEIDPGVVHFQPVRITPYTPFWRRYLEGSGYLRMTADTARSVTRFSADPERTLSICYDNRSSFSALFRWISGNPDIDGAVSLLLGGTEAWHEPGTNLSSPRWTPMKV